MSKDELVQQQTSRITSGAKLLWRHGSFSEFPVLHFPAGVRRAGTENAHVLVNRVFFTQTEAKTTGVYQKNPGAL